jgi:hypothetical protein
MWASSPGTGVPWRCTLGAIYGIYLYSCIYYICIDVDVYICILRFYVYIYKLTTTYIYMLCYVMYECMYNVDCINVYTS